MLGSTFPFATLESRRELEPKCVPQLFLGRLLEMCRSAIGQFFSLFLKWEFQKSLLNVAQPQPGVFLVSKLAKFNEIIAFCHRRSRLVIGSCPGASSSKVPVTFRARKAVLRLHVFIQDRNFNNFENDTTKLSVNEAKLTGLRARNWTCNIQQVLILKFAFGPKNFRVFRETGPWSPQASTRSLYASIRSNEFSVKPWCRWAGIPNIGRENRLVKDNFL